MITDNDIEADELIYGDTRYSDDWEIDGVEYKDELGQTIKRICIDGKRERGCERRLRRFSTE